MTLASKYIKNITIHVQFSFSKSKFENTVGFYITDS